MTSIRPWRDIERRKSRQIMIGSVPVGGDAPISVQTMTNTPTEDARATIDQIRRCEDMGVDIIRVSCPTAEATAALKEIVRAAQVPIVADIHFHYKRALEAADAGAACLRINPGNIGSEERVREVIAAAARQRLRDPHRRQRRQPREGPARKIWRALPGGAGRKRARPYPHPRGPRLPRVQGRVKASDVFLAVAAYQQLAEQVDCPLHLGITEAGGLIGGTVKSRIGIGNLLWAGHRRHDPRLALGRAGRGGPRRLRDPQEPRHPQPRRPRRLLPELRSPGVRRDPHRRSARIAAAAHQDADVAVRPRLRRQRPGEARETDIGITGGGNGKHMVYLSGLTDHHVQDADMIEHIVRLVEAKARRSRRPSSRC